MCRMDWPNARNISQQGGQTYTTCCAQQCCKMLRWNVASVWPGLKFLNIPRESRTLRSNDLRPIVSLLYHRLRTGVQVLTNGMHRGRKITFALKCAGRRSRGKRYTRERVSRHGLATTHFAWGVSSSNLIIWRSQTLWRVFSSYFLVKSCCFVLKAKHLKYVTKKNYVHFQYVQRRIFSRSHPLAVIL